MDENNPAHRSAPASSSRESASEPRVKVGPVSVKHSIFSHFPKDINCDFCLRTKFTRVLCRKRTGTAVPRAEKIGDLTTADHKVLSEESESRNNHRYAVVEYSSVMYHTRVESGNEALWSLTLRNWKRWTHLKSVLRRKRENYTEYPGEC